ncbi:MAG: hypothetical protein KDE19_22735, partial [Caldilineaceae bacterium]|nr:hypothetical protein [Caldilineaceae bacterium]
SLTQDPLAVGKVRNGKPISTAAAIVYADQGSLDRGAFPAEDALRMRDTNKSDEAFFLVEDETMAAVDEDTPMHFTQSDERPENGSLPFTPAHRNLQTLRAAEAPIILKDEPASQYANPEPPAWTIMIVDDEPEVHQVTILALQRFTYAERPLHFISAYSATEAETLIAAHSDVAIILLDVVMETNHAGLDFVHYLRKELKNKRTRIVLRTGQPGEAPEEAIIREYDINDYKTKTELTRQKLRTTILVSLRTYEQLLSFEANQTELETLYRRLSERNAELQRAKDVAEAASRAKDEFLSLMNHELRTPLNVILMRAEILDNGVHGHLSVKQKKSLAMIRNSGHHLLSIIDDILDLAGIENGKLTVIRRPVSANDACLQSVELVQSLADAKQIAIKLILQPATVWVYADERRLVQVIEKLLRNAVKFSCEHATIGLELASDEAVGLTHITVWDEGIGIAAMDIARLFQPFVQLEQSLTRRYEGAGLGLSIASKLTKLMDGTISVDSSLGQGSRFTITLPLAPNR